MKITRLFTTANQDRKMTAVFIDGEITLDGKLDEPEWSLAEPAKDFIQKLPATGEPATEPTEVRLLAHRLHEHAAGRRNRRVVQRGSHDAAILDAALEQDIVAKSGTWFAYEGQKIGQGRGNARTYLKEHPETADEIEAKVREKIGISKKTENKK